MVAEAWMLPSALLNSLHLCQVWRSHCGPPHPPPPSHSQNTAKAILCVLDIFSSWKWVAERSEIGICLILVLCSTLATSQHQQPSLCQTGLQAWLIKNNVLQTPQEQHIINVTSVLPQWKQPAPNRSLTVRCDTGWRATHLLSSSPINNLQNDERDSSHM